MAVFTRFRFADTRTLFHEENTRRQEAAARRLAAEAADEESVGKALARRGHGMTIATPPVLQLTMNYRWGMGLQLRAPYRGRLAFATCP